LSHVASKHLFEASERLFGGKLAKVVDQPLLVSLPQELLMEAYIGREELSVDDNSLDIIQILVMF